MQFKYPKNMPFPVNPSSLIFKKEGTEYYAKLYEKYKKELIELTALLSKKRAQILEGGYRADFGDMEAEFLYMLVRETTPDVVLEISPCHGYSTNYILAALTRNENGRVISYELTEETHGRKTKDVILGNLIEGVDKNRVEIVIGDVTKTSIPNCDVAFIDSCHEAWFAAWYIQDVIPKAKLCFVHDIVVSQSKFLIPKALTIGVRESYQLLHSLSVQGVSFASIAAIELILEPKLRDGLTPRKGYPERSIIFPGFTCNSEITAICAAQKQLLELRHQVLLGDRIGAIKGIREIASLGSKDTYTRLSAYHIIAELGYRVSNMDMNLTDLLNDVKMAVSHELGDVSTFVAALELGTKLNDDKLVSLAMKSAKKLKSDSTQYINAQYRQNSMPFNRLVATGVRHLRKALRF